MVRPDLEGGADEAYPKPPLPPLKEKKKKSNTLISWFDLCSHGRARNKPRKRKMSGFSGLIHALTLVLNHKLRRVLPLCIY